MEKVIGSLCKRLIAFLLITFCSLSSAQTKQPDWQATAIKKYPELGVAGSAFNKRFLQIHDNRQKNQPAFFNNPRWPVLLADEIANSKQAKSQPASTPQPTAVEASPGLLGIVAITTIAVIWIVFSTLAKAARRRRLFAKYGDQDIVDKIVKRMFWTNQTREQLIDSLGEPVDIGKKVLKTKVVETWKYNRTGQNRFALRLTVEDGHVTGWDQK